MVKRVTLPKGVWFSKRTLATGEVVRYGYYGRGPGTEPLGREGSADFHTRLAEILRKAPAEGRVSHLIWRYKNSGEFAKLRPLTQRDYNRQLDKVQTKFGMLRIQTMAAREISDHIFRWRDEMAKTSPRQADYAISVLSALLKWSVTRGLISDNRARGVGDAYTPDRKDKIWKESEEERFHAVAPEHVSRVAIFAIESGLAQQDLLALTGENIRERIIVTRRLKNGTPVAVPISPRLREVLNGLTLKPAERVLLKPDGQPWDAKGNGLRNAFRDSCAAAGITGLTFHDQRGTYVTRRRAMGWTAEETALTTGHKISGEAGAQGSYVSRESVAIANAERLWKAYYAGV